MVINQFSGAYKFLSNFYEHPIVYKGARYPTSEHAYQAAKFTDLEVKRRIASVHNPGKAKRLAYSFLETHPNIVVSNWDDIKISIMEEIVRIKFDNPVLAARLIETRDHLLIEGNVHGDRFWGVSRGFGYNHLGNILMKIRSDLKAAL